MNWNEFRVACVVRAMPPGHFTLPAAVVQDMYQGQIMWRTVSGTTEVKTKVRKVFFFEKKNQKTFVTLAPSVPDTRSLMSKSFLLLFFKKEVFLSMPYFFS